MARLIGFSTVDKGKAPFRVLGKECVLRDLQNEFYTKKGERPMRPSFGCIIWDLLIDPATGEVEKPNLLFIILTNFLANIYTLVNPNRLRKKDNPKTVKIILYK